MTPLTDLLTRLEGAREEIARIIRAKVRHRHSRGHYSAQHGHYGVYHFSGDDEAADSIIALLRSLLEEAE